MYRFAKVQTLASSRPTAEAAFDQTTDAQKKRAKSCPQIHPLGFTPISVCQTNSALGADSWPYRFILGILFGSRLMAHGSRLMAHDSWLMAHDSWLMAHGSWPIKIFMAYLRIY